MISYRKGGLYAVSDCLRVTFEFADPYAAGLFARVMLSRFGKDKGIKRLVNRCGNTTCTQPPNINMNIMNIGLQGQLIGVNGPVQASHNMIGMNGIGGVGQKTEFNNHGAGNQMQ